MKESPLFRLLDRYLGSLLCLLFSCLKPFMHREAPTEIRRVLYIELFEMGAAIMGVPALSYLRRKVPNVEMYCLTVRGNVGSWRIVDQIPTANIFAVDGSSFFAFAFSLLRHIIALRRLEIDLIIDFEKFARISALTSFLIGAKRVAGFHRYEYEGLYRGNLVDTRCAFNQNEHISRNFLALTKTALGESDHFPNYKGSVVDEPLHLPRFTSNPEQSAKITDKLETLFPGIADQHLIVVCPDVGGNLTIRNYPAVSYVAVVNDLLDTLPETVIAIVGMEENRPTCDYIHQRVANKRCINFCAKTESLDELMELINRSRLLIGNDNGPLHFASLCDTAILGIFSTDTPFMYGPLGNCVALYTFYHCSPCISALNNKRSRCRNNLCIKSIPPRVVSGMALRLWRNEVQVRTINGTTPYL